MICDQCQQREATVHLTQIFCGVRGDDTTKRTDLCSECARDVPGFEKEFPMDQFLASDYSQEKFLTQALGQNPPYPIKAYEFVCEALDLCRNLPVEKPEHQPIRHVSGQEFLEVVRQLALKKFSKQAKAVLRNWKICRTEDFGEIVFGMVDAGLLMKRPEDAKADFQNGFSFDEAFPEV
jgi:uncharacterized repeat protein (TIGR04138 family)